MPRRLLAVLLLAAGTAVAQVPASELLRVPAFKANWSKTLGAHAAKPWLARMPLSGPLRDETIAGRRWQVAGPCKPHDCADHNAVVAFDPVAGAILVLLHEKGRESLLGEAHSPTATAEMKRIWLREFRQR